MNVLEARRVRHLSVRLDAGDTVPQVLQKALGDAEVQRGTISGVGWLAAAELAFDSGGVGGAGRVHARHLERAMEVVTLTGTATRVSGVLEVTLFATLAWESETGIETVAGRLVGGRAGLLELHVVAFEDGPAPRGLSEAHGAGEAKEGGSPRAEPARYADPREGAGGSAPEVVVPLAPPRSLVVRTEEETYPETGDSVFHFHFGECTVITSDGDRIRLRQTKDGRVREVALHMLRVEEFTTLPDGTRHFALARKN